MQAVSSVTSAVTDTVSSIVTGDEISIGNYLLERLIQLGVKSMFGVPGDFNMPFLDFVEDHPSIQYVGCANELNAGYAADGYARVTGRFGAVCTTFGVGELSATNAIAGSHSERVPVVHIAGVPSTELQAHKAILHHTLGDGRFDAFIKIAENITAGQAILMSAKTAGAEIDKVLETAMLQARPVYITLPTDLVNKKTSAAPLKEKLQPSLEHPNQEQTVDFLVDRIAQLFENAEKPVVLIDGCAVRYHTTKDVEKLVEKTGVTFFTSPMGKGALSEHHPNFGGVYVGEISLDPVREAFETATFTLAIGTMKSDFNTGAFSWKMSPERTVELHSDHVILQYGRFESISFNSILPKLIERLGRLKPSQIIQVTYEHAIPKDNKAGTGVISQKALWPLFGQFLKDGDVCMAETGTSLFGLLEVRLPPGATFAGQVLWGSIGWAGGAILGASTAADECDPPRRTLMFMGDGSYQLTIQEMSTLIRYGRKPIIFLLNNDGYTIERFIHGPNRKYNDIQPWKWTKFFDVFGAAEGSYETYQARSLEDLSKLLANPVFAKADKIQLVELFMEKMDAPRALELQAKATAKVNA